MAGVVEPKGKLIPIIFPPCGTSAVYTARFAGEPESGWTFTAHPFGGSLKSFSARSCASASTLSESALPP